MSLVPARADARTADFVARRAGVRWAIELRTSSRALGADAAFVAGSAGPLPYPTLEAYFALLWREKRAQLEATMRAEGCPRGLLLVAARGEAGTAWTDALRRSWEAAGEPDAVAFGVLAPASLRVFPPLGSTRKAA